MTVAIVTGGAGFIGSRLAACLLAKGMQVVIIDNLSTGQRSNIPSEATFVLGDCSRRATFNRLPDLSYSVIFHIAGQSSGEISFEDPHGDLKSNLGSTLEIINFAAVNGVKKIVFASSMAIYGEQQDEVMSEWSSIPAPKSYYAVSKLASEHYLNIASRHHKISVTVLRLFNVYGNGQNLENRRQGMLSIYLAQLFEDGRIHVKGSGDRFRDFVHVDDVVACFIRAYEEGNGFDIFNVGTGVKTTVFQLIEIIKRFHRDPFDVEFSGETPGDMRGVIANSERIGRILGIRNYIPIDIGVRQMIDGISHSAD